MEAIDTLIFHLMKKRKKNFQKTLPAGKFYRRALEVAKQTTLEDLFRKTDLPLSWLMKFRRGEIQNPSVNRIEKILESFGRI